MSQPPPPSGKRLENLPEALRRYGYGVARFPSRRYCIPVETPHGTLWVQTEARAEELRQQAQPRPPQPSTEPPRVEIQSVHGQTVSVTVLPTADASAPSPFHLRASIHRRNHATGRFGKKKHRKNRHL